MELRDWLVLLCLLAIVLIFLDGYRRWKARPKYKGGYLSDPEEVSDFPSAELPAGGARVRPITPEEIVARNESLNLRVKVPILMDSVEEDENKAGDEEKISEPSPQQEIDLQDPEPKEQPLEHDEENLALDLDDPNEPKLSFDDVTEGLDLEPETGLPESESKSASAPEELESLELSSEEDETSISKSEERIDLFADNGNDVEMMEPQQLISINVMANEGEFFEGDQLLQILLACGMRFGSMEIFHRTDDQNKLQFSVANCVKPGIFNLDEIGQSRMAGVSFFMTLPCAAEAMESFDYMYETANVLARHLHGVMLDENRSVFTAQRVEHCRNQIREFSRAQLIPS